MKILNIYGQPWLLHIIAEKKGRKYAIVVKYGKSKFKEEEKVTISELKMTGCIPSLLNVTGDINKDKWKIRWKEI